MAYKNTQTREKQSDSSKNISHKKEKKKERSYDRRQPLP